MFTSKRSIFRYAATIAPSSATSTLVLAVFPGASTFSATEPATIESPRRAGELAQRGRASGPSSGSAPASRCSSGPMKAKFSGSADEAGAEVGGLVHEPRCAVARFFSRSGPDVIWTAPMR